MSSLVEANTEFGVDLLKEMLKKDSNENIFFSPMSISAALAMVLLGANGNTAKQMGKVLHFDKITGSVSSKPTDAPATGACCDQPGGPHEQFKELLTAINQHTQKYALSTANRLYASDAYKFRQHYLDCTKYLYHAGLETADFSHAAEETRKKINSWVESQTHGKIKDLLNKIDPETILILVNAIYFKGKWKLQFEEKNTYEAPFWIGKNQTKQVLMMHMINKFNLAKIKNPPMQVLELPYSGGGLSMFILLPDNKEYSDQLCIELSYAKLHEWTSSSNMRAHKLDVSIPKFKLEETYSLKPFFEAMGMTDVFTPGKADLSGMSEDDAHNLLLSWVVHKSFIEVNEEGTEAAAATAGGVTTTSMEIFPKFVADHPFFFIIREKTTKTIVFFGKFSSP